MQSFWQKLPRPFFALAPMADVTDPAFRALIARYDKPDVMYTEFISADGLHHALAGKLEKNRALGPLGQFNSIFSDLPAHPLLRDAEFTEAERPIVLQVFSGKPEMIAYAAKLAEALGFDGFDINMGCPDRAIERQGAGARLIKTPKLAQELIRTAKSATALPVSVKTRIGFNTIELEEWLPALLEAEPAAIALHLRTRREMSAVPAHWELMKRAVEIRSAINPRVLLIGNGNVKSVEEARQKAAETGVDGVMLGRAIFGNPWLFSEHKNPSLEEKLEALVELAQAFEKLSPPKHFAILKKHVKAFVAGFDGASELRAKLMESENAQELSDIVQNFSVLLSSAVSTKENGSWKLSGRILKSETDSSL